MRKYIGCDLGGTNFRAGVVDLEIGSISHQASIPTLARQGHEAVMARMSGLINRIVEESSLPREEIGGIGIGVPGVLDLDRGMVIFLPNLLGNWPHVPLAETITRQTGFPVCLLNDVRAITYGEWKYGAGRGADTMACFAIGTGVGGGLVINGKLHLGIGGTAGELGHQTVEPNGYLCGCGNRGCLEAYSSGPAIAAMGMKAVSQGLTTQIAELVENDLNRITPKIIHEAASQGDRIAKDIFQRAGTYLGIAVANVLVSVGPRRVVIAGGVSQAGDFLLEPIRRVVKERVFVMPVDKVEILQAELGNDAGVIGVASWTRENLKIKPSDCDE
jgi:glucokinase